MSRSASWAYAFLAVLAGTASLSVGDVAAARPIRSPVEALRAVAIGSVEIGLSPTTGRVAFFSAPSGGGVVVAGGGSAEDRARGFLSRHGSAFGVGDPAGMFLLNSAGPDEVGLEHARFQQVHDGVPVTGGEISVHLDAAGVVAVNSRMVVDLEGVATKPLIPAWQAQKTVAEILRRHPRDAATLPETPRLELFNRGHLEGRRTATRLAWFVEARGPAVRRFLWLDAETGAVLLDFSQLPHAVARLVYDAELGAAMPLPGTLVRAETDPPTLDPEVDAAFDFAGDTHTYFLGEHGRDSYDGAGAALVSTVRYCQDTSSCPFDNAFWNGSQIVLGNGWAAADDVIAHEITHAVIEATAGLFYYMQSGALSESYADIFGEAVDLGNGSGSDAPEVRWLMGEDAPGGARRSLSQPELFGDPGRMSDWRFVCEDPGDDYGGVHSNSGVPNHAFALMTDGGLSNGVPVAGIGLAKAARLHYRALTVYLLSAANFLDHRQALLRSCQDLVGVDGIQAEDCAQVANALEAVELDLPWPCDGEPSTANELCPADELTAILFFDDLEAGAANWSSSTTVGDDAWFRADYFASSGEWHLWGDDPDAPTDSCLEMASDVEVPPDGAYLVFRHSFGFESDPWDNYDGGVVEVSQDGGGTWSDAGALIVAGAAYRGLLDDTFENPLGGRHAFVGDSWGYTASQLDLTSLSGLDVRFRFRVGADLEIGDYGWFIDDVAMYQCPVGCLQLPRSGCLGCEPALALESGPPVDGPRVFVGCDVITAGVEFGVGARGQVDLIAPRVEFLDGFFVETDGELKVVTN